MTQNSWKQNLIIMLLTILVAVMCLILNEFSKIYDLLNSEPPAELTVRPPQAFHKCGRSGKTTVYCPILQEEYNGSSTLRPTR
jgi:hypothetical protein